MSIRVVTDSTCDLPQHVAQALGITVIPNLICIGEKILRDGLDLSRREFYECLPETIPAPRSFMPEIAVVRQTYERLAGEGATQIISIHTMESLSTAYSTACRAAEETRTVPVTVVNARSISVGMGFQAELAARSAAAGKSVPDILALLDEQARRIHVVAILDMIEYLRRSGRMNDTLSGFARLLHFKPVLRITNNQYSTEPLSTRQRVNDRLAQILAEVGTVERLTFLHSNAEDRVDSLRAKVKGLLPPGEIMVVEITPAIGVHVGPGAVGFACVAVPKE